MHVFLLILPKGRIYNVKKYWAQHITLWNSIINCCIWRRLPTYLNKLKPIRQIWVKQLQCTSFNTNVCSTLCSKILSLTMLNAALSSNRTSIEMTPQWEIIKSFTTSSCCCCSAMVNSEELHSTLKQTIHLFNSEKDVKVNISTLTSAITLWTPHFATVLIICSHRKPYLYRRISWKAASIN